MSQREGAADHPPGPLVDDWCAAARRLMLECVRPRPTGERPPPLCTSRCLPGTCRAAGCTLPPRLPSCVGFGCGGRFHRPRSAPGSPLPAPPDGQQRQLSRCAASGPPRRRWQPTTRTKSLGDGRKTASNCRDKYPSCSFAADSRAARAPLHAPARAWNSRRRTKQDDRTSHVSLAPVKSPQ